MTSHYKYFDTYAEPECHLLDNFPDNFQQGLVIPIYKEDISVAKYFSDFAETNIGTLLIIVLNRPETDLNISWCTSFLNHFQKNILSWRSNHLSLYALNNNSSVLVIDRCIAGAAIPDDQGVGLARKIGADVLCYLIDQGAVYSDWIANTDADASLPTDYFTALQSQEKSAAVIFPYQHIFLDEETLRLPTLLYEFSLHYYVEGLKDTGSPYGYHTIGSTIAAHKEAYIHVRGFPKRSGGEDFYLLNKLAKIGRINCLDKPIINIRSRLSDRVPFGTGPAVIKLSEMKNPLSASTYHPDSFRYLKAMNVLLECIANSDKEATIEHYQKNLLAIQDEAICITSLAQITTQLGLHKAIHHCFNNAKTATARKKHLHHWFDGFKTLKFIHLLREKKLGTVSYQDLFSRGYAFEKNKKLIELTKRIKNEL